MPNELGLYNTPTAPLQRGNTANECPGYDTKQSDGDVSVMLDHWEMWSTSSLPSLLSSLRLRLVTPNWFLFMDPIEQNCVLMRY